MLIDNIKAFIDDNFFDVFHKIEYKILTPLHQDDFIAHIAYKNVNR